MVAEVPAPAPAPAPTPQPSPPEQTMLDLWTRIADALDQLAGEFKATSGAVVTAAQATMAHPTFIGPGSTGTQAVTLPVLDSATAVSTTPVDTQP